jgi:predicted nuclease of predicted toxin-antitoxin system
VRFFLDNDVDAAVARELRLAGHDCWTAADAGVNDFSDDQLTVYAHRHGAVLVTHDKEFSRRRRQNTIGHHLQLRCAEWDAAGLLVEHLEEIITLFSARADLFVVLSPNQLTASSKWA